MNEGKFQDGANPGTVLYSSNQGKTDGYSVASLYQLCWMQLTYLWHSACRMDQQRVNPPATPETQETGVRSLGRPDALKEETATHPGILARRIPWTEEPGGLGPQRGREWDTRERVSRQTARLQSATRPPGPEVTVPVQRRAPGGGSGFRAGSSAEGHFDRRWFRKPLPLPPGPNSPSPGLKSGA